MAEYTYDNILINPLKGGIENLIGEEVYFHNNPSLCLDYANKKSTDHLGVLVKIRKNSLVPFTIKQGHSVNEYSCIIEKKEEPKPKYVPFRSKEEFLERYMEVKDELGSDSFESSLLQCGMWIKVEGVSDGYCMVTEIWNDGIVLGYSKLFTIQEVPGRYSTVTQTTSWDNLCKDFTFLDDTPCGKPMEE